MPHRREKERIYAIRRRRLAELADELGGPAALARHLGKSPMPSLGNPSYVSRMLSGRPRAQGGKNITGDTAAEIERVTGKPPGWLSRESDEDGSLLVDYAVWDRLSPEQKQAIETTVRAMIAGFLGGDGDNERRPARKAS